MVLGEAAPSKPLTARALEIEAGRIHEHDVERGEQVAPAGEQLLLHNASRSAAQTASRRPAHLRAAPRRATPISRSKDGRLSTPFGPDRYDAVPGRRRRRCDNPRVSGRRRGPSRRTTGGAARSGTARSSENSWLRALARRSITPRQPVSSQTRSKASAGPTRRVAIVVASPRSSASSTIALSAKRAPERRSRSGCRSP